MPPGRHEFPAAHLRAVRDACTHRFSDHSHWQALKLRQNVAPEIHGVERSVITPPNCRFALLRGRRSTSAQGLWCSRWIVAGCAHSRDLGRPSGFEGGDRGLQSLFTPIGKVLVHSQVPPIDGDLYPVAAECHNAAGASTSGCDASGPLQRAGGT